MIIGHCPHGEFDLDKGCPECIEERRRKEAALEAERSGTIPEDTSVLPMDAALDVPLIVKVQYWSDAKGEAAGREYSFFTVDPLDVGEFVQVPTAYGATKARVSAVNIPDAEIAAFRDRVKTIPSGSIRPDPSVPTNQESVEIETTEVPFTLPESQVGGPNLFAGNAPGLFDLKPEERFHCPADCGFSIPANYSHDNPEPGGCGNEEAVPENASLENDPTLPLCPGFKLAPPEPNYEPPQEEATVVLAVDLEEGTVIPPALITIERQVGKPAPELLQLYNEAASLLRVAKDRVIATNEDLKPATNDLAIIATCKKAMFARKTELVGPLKAKLDQVNQAFNDIMFPVEEADRLTRGQVTKYDNQVRAQVAEARRIEDEKFKLAQEEAANNGTGEITVPLNTAQAPPPPPERTRTDLGTLGGRDNWKARVVSFKDLDDAYKLADMQTLNAKARSSKGTAVIPGVEFYNERSTTIRTK